MKTKTTGLRVALGAVLIAGVAGMGALAQSGDRDKLDKVFDRIDANGDGVATRAEVLEARRGRMASADSDGDGAVSIAEFTAAATERAERRASRVFARLDDDGDGLVTSTELEESRKSRRADRFFDRFDADGDGAVSREEMRKKARPRVD